MEVVSPGPGENGVLGKILAAQGTSFYHLCFEIDESTDETLSRLAKEGIRAVTVRQRLPAVLFGGRDVSFHMVHGFGLVEFLEPPESSV